MRSHSWRTPGLLLALPLVLASVAGPVGAQGPTTGQFTIAPGGGVMTFERASSIESGGSASLDAQYAFLPMLSIGTHVLVARAQTRGEDFLTRLTFGSVENGDTTYIFSVSQPVNIVNAALSLTAQMPVARLRPYLTGGVGVYSVHLDPQVMAGESRFARMSGMLGGGIDFRLTESSGLRLDVRDVIFTNFDRDRLRPSDSRFLPVTRAEDLPAPPEAKDVLHNVAFTIGFSYTPRRAATTGGEEQ